MKYLKMYMFFVELGLAFVALIIVIRMIVAVMAVALPVLDAVVGWMADHALVGGLVVAIGFLVFWLGEECERQIRKERKRK